MIRSLNRIPRPAIPTKVVERIIDTVAELVNRLDWCEIEERNQSLRACALVARSWVPRSRRHLFCLVRLGSDRRTRQFLDSLALSPALGKYVETLQTWPRNNDEDTCGWIFKALSSLPPLLPHLRELALCNLPDLRPECIAVLSRFRTVESLVLYFLERQSLREVILLINRFPQLRRLYVDDCIWKPSDLCHSRRQHNFTALHVKLDTECETSLLEWALASESISALTSFRVSSDASGLAMDRILEMCYSTLRELHLDLFEDFGAWLWMLFSIRSPVTSEAPLLTNHLKLQCLALEGDIGDVIRVLGRLPLFALHQAPLLASALFSGLTTQWKI